MRGWIFLIQKIQNKILQININMPAKYRKTMRNLSAVSGKKRSKRVTPVKRTTAIVERVIRRRFETKYVCTPAQVPDGSSVLTTFTGFSSAINGIGEIYGAIPQVTQGDDDFQRIGAKLSPISAYVDMNITVANQSDPLASDKTVHVFMLKSHGVRDLANYSAIPITTLLDDGQGGSVSFDGTTTNAMYNVDGRLFSVVRHFKKRLVKGYGLHFGSGTGSNAGTTDSTITPSNSYVSLRIKVPLPKVLTYSSKSATYPDNAAPFFVIGWTRNDSAGGSALSTVNTYVQAKCHLRYKDA